MISRMKYAISMIKRHGKYRYFWEYQIIDKILRRIMFRNNEGVYIMNEDWDYLIILDACRYDAFENEIKHRKLAKIGKLEYRISRGSDTSTFLLENFKGKYYDDVVYVTANPFVDMLVKDSFYKVISVWNKGWNEKYNTVLPSTVYEYALNALRKYPNKRLIIHFMQPHHPFLSLCEIKDEGFKYQVEKAIKGKSSVQGQTVWHYFARGLISREKIWQAYRENLRMVMEYVERLVNLMTGKIVITSDHGNAFGEKIHPLLPIRVYAHPRGVRIPSLVKVPWFVIERYEDQYEIKKKIEREIIRLRIGRLKAGIGVNNNEED